MKQMTNKRQPPLALPQTQSDVIEQVAVAIERTMFAPHEFPLDPELHRKYRTTAKAAVDAMNAATQKPTPAPDPS